MSDRVAEVVQRHEGPSPKSLDLDENLSPIIHYFVAIYALFGDLWAQKVPFWVKNSVSWARSALLHGMLLLLLQMIVRDQPLANDHPNPNANANANDYPEGPASCK